LPDSPRAFGRYEVQEEIGRGMMGIVYRATDPVLGRTVALKTINVAFSLAEAERSVYEKRFLNEARVAAAFAHPGIVVVHDVGWDPDTGTPYVALEFLKGRTLADIMAGGDPMPWEQALRITAKLGAALQYAHAQGVVHRDIKPTNIMISPEGEPKIMDFGIAKVPHAQLTAAGEFFGTPSYMSPEQISAHPVDGRSDLFSLGAVLYLMLTGQRAFDGETVPTILNAVSHRHPAPPGRLVRSLPPDIDYLVSRALAKDPAERYASGTMFAEDIDDVLAGRTPRHRGDWKGPQGAESTLAHHTPMPHQPETMDLKQPETVPGRAQAVTAPFGADLISKRDFIAVGVLAALGLVAALTLPRVNRPSSGAARPAPPPVRRPSPVAQDLPSPSAEPSASASLIPSPSPSSSKPARLAVSVEHPFKTGTLRVLVDGQQEMELALESRRKLGFMGARRGEHSAAVDVPAGKHTVRVEVKAEDSVLAGTIVGSFKSGKSRTLGAKVDGRPRRLLLSWQG
jgi:eukaryotic-like serine/threonine-protein kinase